MAEAGVLSAREAYERGDWGAARSAFLLARATDRLAADDLARLSAAAWWLGDGELSIQAAEEAFEGHVRDDPVAAALQACALSMAWTVRGDLVVGQGWLNRARRLLAEEPEGLAHGYLAYVEAATALDFEDDPGPARRRADQLARWSRELGDDTLGCFALVLSGMVRVRAGETERGFGDLDEAMLPVLRGRVPALWAGDVYCTVIHLCHQLADFARMRAWTDALHHWSAPLSATFLYAGVTRVHQLQLLAAEGEWDTVEAELAGASRTLVGAHGWVAGAGFYELGEVRRLRGDLAGAAAAFEQAAELGVPPQPGAALLAHQEGRLGEGLSMLRAAIAESGRLERAGMLLPAVELATAAGDGSLAASACHELVETADQYGTSGLRAWADHARARRLLAVGRWAEALTALESAASGYRAQRWRHAMGRVHEAMAEARRGLGDDTAAAADEATALAIYRSLGALLDVERLAGRSLPGGLTAREVDVLSCVASGASNREVAAELFISEKTVSRHLANIYLKAGVGTRTAAAAWARDHGISPRP